MMMMVVVVVVVIRPDVVVFVHVRCSGYGVCKAVAARTFFQRALPSEVSKQNGESINGAVMGRGRVPNRTWGRELGRRMMLGSWRSGRGGTHGVAHGIRGFEYVYVMVIHI